MKNSINLNENIIIQGDAASEMSKLDSNSVDLILTDPPYNLGIFMKNRDTNISAMRENHFSGKDWDQLDNKDWLVKMDQFLKEGSRVLKPKGALISFMAALKVGEIINIAQKHNFYYKTTGIWHKTNPMPRNKDLHFVNSVESWIYFVIDSKTSKFNNNGKLIHDFFESSNTPKSEKKHGGHPTQKPVSILEHFINILTDKNDVVLDPFMGSGSTGVAAIMNKRKFIGIELEKKYTNIAKKRIQDVLDNESQMILDV